ncbi:MAG: acetyl-CoA carboxylase biotin carboxyl carrier protein [Ignavibacteriales bacterium]|nr:MAG: acetyl-CoA carboxylase biotin carboxyl carrier protein [Ignavibacteriales bacterium]
MDLNLLKKLIRLVDTSNITDLEVEENGLRVKIAKKTRSYAQGSQPHIVMAPAHQPADVIEQKASSEAKQTSEEKPSNTHEIRSPIVGTFYRAPAPDADAYVQVGDMVSAGSVLCIVEAMKLMNEIESDIGGKIIRILVENGKPVEYNQPLFLIEKS